MATKKRLMIIGAGIEQAPLVKRAKDLGYWILATDWTKDGEGLKYANVVEVSDPRDINKLTKLFKAHGIEAVIADNCDYGLYSAGIICQKFGLPGPNFNAISNSNNKKKLRQACQKAGIKQPAFYACNTFDDLLEGVKWVGGYPVIVKPVDNRGNFGVNKVESAVKLKEAFFEAIANAHSREFLVEKFIHGTMMTVDGFCFKKGEHRTLAVSSKKMLGGKKRVAMEIVFPADLSPKIIEKAMEINDKVAGALDYGFGFTHAEYLLDDKNGLWLVESASRGGGGFISELIVPALTGIDLLKLLIQESFGQFDRPIYNEKQPMQNAAILSFLKFSSGKIKAIRGLEEARALPGVLRCYSTFKIGDTISQITNDANRHGFTVITAKTKEQARETVKKVKKMIKIEYT